MSIEIESFKKAQLRAALATVLSEDEMPAKSATKADLVVAYGKLKNGPRATAHRHLMQAHAKASEKAPKGKGAGSKKNGSGHAASGQGKARIRLAGASRAIYGKAWTVADGILTFVRENGNEQEIPVAEVEEVLMDESGELESAVA